MMVYKWVYLFYWHTNVSICTLKIVFCFICILFWRALAKARFCMVDRTKTPRFVHSSTLYGVHIGQKTLFWVVIGVQIV
ncbi:hypothetical protein HanRHA438_Chr17g0795501 [Helianthus annuus]|nr:hypothetical protein HanIR_Chr17g0852081 [Helianthus annuus]KAJ0824725.1 hypothetical protein HanRHA438_Chr17g0795501 [Helianthus annuus]